jgi:triphosphoribosyl-dephospho-CoA synthase
MDPDKVSFLAVSASLLELAGWPKPGNVHRTADFPGTRFEHFMVGAASLYPFTRLAALGDNRFGTLTLGHVKLSYAVQKGGNTHLGTAMLLLPLSYAAGKIDAVSGVDDLIKLGKSATESLKLAGPEEAAKLYEAIRLSMNKESLGSYSEGEVPDVNDPEAVEKLRKKGLSVFDVLKVSSEWDMVAAEMTSGYPISVDGFRTYVSYEDPNVACVNTFLKILSEHGDTFIARAAGSGAEIRDKVADGLKKMAWVREKAGKALSAGGLSTPEGRAMVEGLDVAMRKIGWSPGSVADLVASSIFMALLMGKRI